MYTKPETDPGCLPLLAAPVADYSNIRRFAQATVLNPETRRLTL